MNHKCSKTSRFPAAGASVRRGTDLWKVMYGSETKSCQLVERLMWSKWWSILFIAPLFDPLFSNLIQQIVQVFTWPPRMLERWYREETLTLFEKEILVPMSLLTWFNEESWLRTWLSGGLGCKSIDFSLFWLSVLIWWLMQPWDSDHTVPRLNADQLFIMPKLVLSERVGAACADLPMSHALCGTEGEESLMLMLMQAAGIILWVLGDGMWCGGSWSVFDSAVK